MPRVLVVDDDPWVSALLAATLTSAQHEVQVATNGRSGWRQAMVEPPDLILLDLFLPDLDGVALCRQLREHPATAALPVVIITADHRSNIKQACLAAGANAFCTKPFSPTALLDLVDQFLPPSLRAA